MTSTHMTGLIFAVLLIFVASSMDYEDRTAERALYCNMVETKVWPDYKNIYSKECPNNR